MLFLLFKEAELMGAGRLLQAKVPVLFQSLFMEIPHTPSGAGLDLRLLGHRSLCGHWGEQGCWVKLLKVLRGVPSKDGPVRLSPVRNLKPSFTHNEPQGPQDPSAISFLFSFLESVIKLFSPHFSFCFTVKQLIIYTFYVFNCQTETCHDYLFSLTAMKNCGNKFYKHSGNKYLTVGG